MKRNGIKSIAWMLILLVVFVGLVGCGENTEPPQDGAEIQSTQAPEASGTPAPDNEEDLPEPAVPVDISTTGGVIIVGVINKDDDGWYLTPEQPLNVEYTYFVDEPSRFEALDRIRLFDPSDDGIEKSVYVGQLVTIEGTFSFYRNEFDKLYLFPYRIYIGKNVEQSCAAPELQMPEESRNLYDPDRPLPKYLLPMVEGGRYVYNAFMLSVETLELMGNDFVYFYLDFVDAFLNYRSECPCPDRHYAEMLSTIIYYEFPLYGVCAEPFEFFKHYDEETQTVSLAYKFDEEEHLDQIDRFMDAANEFLSATSTEQTGVQLARNIYHELCTRVTYDDSALLDLSKKEPHYAYMNHSGVCITFAVVYNQLLTQVGIETTLASCDYLPTIGHAWSIVAMDGELYFCDPTFELNYEGGNSYHYFGLSYADRIKDGVGVNGIFGGRYDSMLLEPGMLAEKSITVD